MQRKQTSINLAAVMKLIGCILAVTVSMAFAYNQNILEFSLRTIKQLESNHIGQFQIIFYDISTEGFFGDILEDVAKSPELQHVVRVVIHGPFRIEQWLLPYNPALILINPGSDKDMTGDENRQNIINVLRIFNPMAKVLAFVDFNTDNENFMRSLVVGVHFNNAIFVDKHSGRLRFCSLKNYVEIRDTVCPLELFKWHRSELRGGKITFIIGRNRHIGTYEWLQATTKLLGANLVLYKGPNLQNADI